jgi:hypothetical protein
VSGTAQPLNHPNAPLVKRNIHDQVQSLKDGVTNKFQTALSQVKAPSNPELLPVVSPTNQSGESAKLTRRDNGAGISRGVSQPEGGVAGQPKSPLNVDAPPKTDTVPFAELSRGKSADWIARSKLSRPYNAQVRGVALEEGLRAGRFTLDEVNAAVQMMETLGDLAATEAESLRKSLASIHAQSLASKPASADGTPNMEFGSTMTADEIAESRGYSSGIRLEALAKGVKEERFTSGVAYDAALKMRGTNDVTPAQLRTFKASHGSLFTADQWDSLEKRISVGDSGTRKTSVTQGSGGKDTEGAPDAISPPSTPAPRSRNSDSSSTSRTSRAKPVSRRETTTAGGTGSAPGLPPPSKSTPAMTDSELRAKAIANEKEGRMIDDRTMKLAEGVADRSIERADAHRWIAIMALRARVNPAGLNGVRARISANNVVDPFTGEGGFSWESLTETLSTGRYKPPIPAV